MSAMFEPRFVLHGLSAGLRDVDLIERKFCNESADEDSLNSSYGSKDSGYDTPMPEVDPNTTKDSLKTSFADFEAKLKRKPLKKRQKDKLNLLYARSKYLDVGNMDRLRRNLKMSSAEIKLYFQTRRFNEKQYKR